MSDFERGVVVDYQGFFLAAIQWPVGQVPPRVNLRGRNGRRLPEERRKTLLTSEAAIADPQPNGRWNAGTETWDLPTERRWIAAERRDKPGFYNVTGSRLVWPERLPRPPDGAKWLDTGPPQLLEGGRFLWSDAANGYVTPNVRMPVDANGVCGSAQLVFDDSEVVVPTGGRVIDPEAFTGTDEQGETRAVRRGDTVDPTDDTVTLRPPKYKRVPVRFVRDAITDAGLGSAFVTFLQGQGYELSDFEGLRFVSLNNKILRAFIQDQGYTYAQALTAIQRAAETAQEAEQAKRAALSEIE